MMEKYVNDNKTTNLGRSIRNMQIFLSFIIKEIIRQTSVECKERAHLLSVIWNLTMGVSTDTVNLFQKELKMLNNKWMEKNNELIREKNQTATNFTEQINNLSGEMDILLQSLKKKEELIKYLSATKENLKNRVDNFSSVFEYSVRDNKKQLESLKKDEKGFIKSKIESIRREITETADAQTQFVEESFEETMEAAEITQ
jgi:hypothetical protein